ncbi:MAG TPA: radical SAM family heme chaperone HemW [Gammaproteobacteria bacterium]|nr:radical SAM family heme chaperone HemW [Gammaproteobacteria bacterium]
MTSVAAGYTPALYIHIPWCLRKCPYCDFNSHLASSKIPESAYVQALLAELEQHQQEFDISEFSSVFFGGGTPSLFSPSAIAALLEGAHTRVGLATDAEITLEANPGTSDYGRFRGYLDAGVNRLSIGVQSFNNQHLHALGRIHNAAEAQGAVVAAKAAGFSRLNLDLMYSLPGQTTEQCEADLQQAIALSPSHLSLYQLSIEPHTHFHAYPPQLPTDDTVAAMEQQLRATLHSVGYVRYEISAYACPGQECRHNLNYWQFGDYLGLGAGAHSKLTCGQTCHRIWNRKHPADYLRQAGKGHVSSGRSQLGEVDLVAEFAINTLRLTKGFSFREFTDRTGLPAHCLRIPVDKGLHKGWLQYDGQRVKATPTGYRFLNNVLELFIAHPHGAA